MRLLLRMWMITVAALVAVTVMFTYAAALTITTAVITFPEVTLDGSTQTVSGSTSPWRAGGTGETSGWNITVVSTDFSNAGDKTIAVANFQIRLLDSNIVVVSGDTSGPESTQITFATLSGAALKIASAAVSEGDGVYDLTPDFWLTVPAETYAGNYIATVTIIISAGP